MCTTCGCGSNEVLIRGRQAGRGRKTDAPVRFRPHAVETGGKGSDATRIIKLEQDILARNDYVADQNRRLFSVNNILALNLVSSPGSGKTTLLVRTLEALKGEFPLAVIEGDQQTDNDAERIRATGVDAIQINTGKGCHLDASMIERAMQQMTLPRGGTLFIENVGNLVCPAAFDLGEAAKVVVLSVTEGEDKPLKYPDMFRAARLMLLNKCDLLPHLIFDVVRAEEYARRVNPAIRIIRISASSGEGMTEWLAWLAAEKQACA
ncbi:MAG: hydrogenase nickel incorporation protein HypB [Sideroxydans sp.]